MRAAGPARRLPWWAAPRPPRAVVTDRTPPRHRSGLAGGRQRCRPGVRSSRGW